MISPTLSRANDCGVRLTMQTQTTSHVGSSALQRKSTNFAAWARSLFALLLLGGLAFGIAACANSNLVCTTAACQELQQVEALNNKVELKGQYCTANPNIVGFLYRVLFIVDVSGSTAQSDPTQQRGPAVQAAIQALATNPEVSFALMSFDSQPNILEPTFTNDLNILLPIIPQLNAVKNATNYLDTLAAAQTIIGNDANTLSPSERARTTYIIQWLSDGVPNPCTQIPEVPVQEQTLLGLVKQYNLLNLTLSTVFLTGAGDGGGCTQGTPTSVMQGMATEGGGTFQALASSQLHFNINISQIVQPFTSRFFYVVNESRVVKNNKLYADSDGDGVSDADETAAGTNPLVADTNNTGCGDGVNAYLTPNNALCPAECAASLNTAGGNVSMLLDSDADGLPDCNEVSLGSGKLNADTDGDNLIDTLEVRFGTNFNDPATLTLDTDGDGIKDADEILQGTNPLSPEANRSLAYVYTPFTSAPSTKLGENCYNFDVTNVQLVQTQQTANSAAGDNHLCIYVEQLPSNSSAANSGATLTKSCFTTNYVENGNTQVKTPADGLITVDSGSFASTICNSSPCH